MDEYQVFISHSSKDRWIAKQMARLIEERGKRHGLKPLLDERDVEAGDNIPDWIRESIKQCRELMVLMSQFSVNRTWVLVEIGAAWGLGKRVVAVVDKVSPQQIPDALAPYKRIDLNDFDEYLVQLVDRAREIRQP